MLPTNGRFLFYELEQLGIVSKVRTGARLPHQNLTDALIHLREAGAVPWLWIVDETREQEEWRTAPTVKEYLSDTVPTALIDRWDGKPAPLILCESRSLAGVLRDIAYLYACPIASTNGQCKGFLVSEVAPTLRPGQRVLYLGDFDRCGMQIEAATKRTLIEHSGLRGLVRRWERVALTRQQVEDNDLPVISKADKRYRPVRYFEAVETEALARPHRGRCAGPAR